MIHLAAITGLVFSLAPQTDAQLQSLAQAYDAGNVVAFRNVLTSLVDAANRDTEAFVQFDLNRRTAKLPTIGEMAVEVRLQSLGQSGGFLNPRPVAVEAALMLSVLKQRIEAVVAESKAAPTMGDEPLAPDALEEYEPLFQEIGRIQTQCGFSLDVVKQLSKLDSFARRQKVVSQKDRAGLVKEIRASIASLQEFHTKAKRREVEMRIARALSAARLLGSDVGNKDRLLASHSLDRDAFTVLAFFGAKAWTAMMPDIQVHDESGLLLEPERVKDYVTAKIEEGKQAAGKDWAVARLLYTALHHWERGRYGRTISRDGLIEPKVPQDTVYVPYTSAESPRYAPERRHLYTWAWEERIVYRIVPRPTPSPRRTPPKAPVQPVEVKIVKLTNPAPIRTSRGGGGGGGGIRGGATRAFNVPYGHQYGPIDRPYSWTVKDVYKAHNWPVPSRYTRPAPPPKPYKPKSLTVSYSRYTTPQDPRSVHRIAGYDEYQRALTCLDTLTHIADVDQLNAADELVKEQKDLAIPTNLTRGRGVSAIDELDFPAESSGLPWLMAIARIEIACALVGFAEQEQAITMLAAKYDKQEYAHMVRDAMRSHYYALKSDQRLASVLTAGSAQDALAYIRRAKLAQALIKGTVVLHRGALSTQQTAQLSAWHQELELLIERLDKRIDRAPLPVKYDYSQVASGNPRPGTPPPSGDAAQPPAGGAAPTPK